MISFSDFNCPAGRAPRHERDAAMRCYKGADTSAAVKEQQLARQQSAAQFKEQMALMRQQYADAQNVKPPVYAPAAPVANGSPDVYDAGLEARRAAKRRFGSAATNLTPGRPLTGGTVPLGA
jgi:hypothetical protein